MNRLELSTVSPLSTPAQELALLQTLKSLLESATNSLSDGDAAALLDTSQRIRATAEDLMAFSIQVARLSGNSEAQLERQKLLAELVQQRAFWRAMLRRWRRSLILRQQILSLQSAPTTYTNSLTSGWMR